MRKKAKIKLIDTVIKNIILNNNLVDTKTFSKIKLLIIQFLDRLQIIKIINRYSLSDFYLWGESVVLSKGKSYLCFSYTLILNVFFNSLYDGVKINFVVQINK